jgi:PAS domain S-box-containing protein
MEANMPGLKRAIPLRNAAAAADSREAMTSPRMSNTIRLDILPDAEDLRRAIGAASSAAGEERQELSLEELHNLFQNAYDATVITTTDGTILFDNIRAREFLYAENGTLAGANITTLISGADATTLQTVAEALDSERFIRISAWCHSVTGAFFPSDIAVYRFASGATQHLCFFIRDITDRIRAEEAERAVERSKVMMESIGSVCHHLGQPSTVVLSSLELLKNLGPGEEAERDELIDMSLKAAGQIGELLKELNELRTYRSESYTDNDSIVAIDE